ncbi:PHB depolymerase family esterase [Nonomuraea sp. NPDC050691]|uniref:alpha/beta hydrolase family esterase n=1 Tax=Nonomuraea sp. NPDC050691 TaxID=3155661 RepID=UPI0033E3897F
MGAEPDGASRRGRLPRARGRAGRRLCGVLLCAVLVVAGCTGRGGRSPTRSPSPTPTSSTASPSLSAGPGGRTGSPGPGTSAAGCTGGGPTLREGRNTLQHGGLERLYLLALPRGRGPHPVLLDLHGMGSTAAEHAAYSRLARRGAARGYIVITPQAADDESRSWSLPGHHGPDDAGFLAALLDLVERRACVDRGRVFAAGMSFGAGMAVRLACARDRAMAGRLAGVAAVAGLNFGAACEHPAPLTVLAFHGTADGTVPYRGGYLGGAMPRGLVNLFRFSPVERDAREWGRALGCAKGSLTEPARTVRLRAWTGCRGGTSVRLYTLRGGGHTWPGAADTPRLGPTHHDLDATKVILDAFDVTPPR